MFIRHGTGLDRNNFDLLRFFFASLVVFSHSFPLGAGNEDSEPLAVLTNHQLTFGSLAVDCFFIISGFLISHSWSAQPNVRRFLEKRVRRIFPGFMVAAAIGAFVITPLFSTAGAHGITGEFVLDFIGRALRLLDSTPGPAFQDNPAAGPVNGSLWSISYEFWCYLGVLALGLSGLLGSRRVLAGALLASLVMSFVFAYFHLTNGGAWLGRIVGYPPIWARLLPYFLVGMAFHAWRDRMALDAKGAVACALIFAVACRVPYGMLFTLPLVGAYLIFWVAFVPSGSLHRFGKHGDFSYGIYLYSFPILQIIVSLNGAPMAPLTLFTIAWPASIAVAAASWYMVERRWLKPRPVSRPAQLAAAG